MFGKSCRGAGGTLEIPSVQPTLNLVDTHVHFDAFRESGDLDAVLERARAAGVRRFIAIGGAPTGNAFAAECAAQHRSEIAFAAGYDRYLATETHDDASLEKILDLPGAAAIGEIGLDYHYGPETKDAQRKLFARMLALARARRLPVVVHSRAAEDDIIAMLKEHAATWPGDPARLGVLHCFTGGPEFVERVLEVGLLVSFSGITSFRNADSIRTAAKLVPADRLLIETDSPYLAPVPHRGQRNEPAFALDVARAVAAARNETLEQIAQQTTMNAGRLFKFQE
ncbi:MAG: TatD family deoxyribonuclease [Verrucomicrobia bacterium]|nr:MAG: TatD family deoxyribonuclease [Verrucomicrobiota bacterium]